MFTGYIFYDLPMDAIKTIYVFWFCRLRCVIVVFVIVSIINVIVFGLFLLNKSLDRHLCPMFIEIRYCPNI